MTWSSFHPTTLAALHYLRVYLLKSVIAFVIFFTIQIVQNTLKLSFLRQTHTNYTCLVRNIQVYLNLCIICSKHVETLALCCINHHTTLLIVMHMHYYMWGKKIEKQTSKQTNQKIACFLSYQLSLVHCCLCSSWLSTTIAT